MNSLRLILFKCHPTSLYTLNIPIAFLQDFGHWMSNGIYNTGRHFKTMFIWANSCEMHCG